jgi:thiamine pyrophosphokinase
MAAYPGKVGDVLPDVVVLANGDPLPSTLLPDVADAIDRARLTVAADGGLHHADRAGRDVDVIVGDLDSVAPAALARARRSGTEVIEHPADKDATDLELALSLVVERWDRDTPAEVLVIGGHGGRTDHLLANVLLLGAERYARLRIRAWLGTDVVHVVRDTVTFAGAPGSTVSLMAVHGPATGVTTTGLRFPLEDARLEPGSSRGISNELSAARATVAVDEGVVIVVLSGGH